MANTTETSCPTQWVSIARAAAARGCAVPQPGDGVNRGDWSRELQPILKQPIARSAQTVTPEERNASAEALKQRAGLELRLAKEADRVKALEASLASQADDYREAISSLTLQQKRLKEAQDERTKLLATVSELESKLRSQINETEQLTGKLERLNTSQRAVGMAATEQMQRSQALESEVADLKKSLEAARRERDVALSGQDVQLATVRSRSYEGVSAEMWSRRSKIDPDIFADTHTPTVDTLERMADAILDLARAMQVLEEECAHRVRDLRFVADADHPMNALHMTLHNRPKLDQVVRKHLIGRAEAGELTAAVREIHALMRGLLNGCYVAIVRSREIAADELNYRLWPARAGLTRGEDAAIGQYFRETASVEVPDKLGTALRRLAGVRAAEDYAELRMLIER
ncbi:MAG: hypothetical protein ACKVS9_10925 [Phycisphaerae bacterium]